MVPRPAGWGGTFQIVLPVLITSLQRLWPPGSWSNCACPRRSPFVTQPPRHPHTEVDCVWIMSSTHHYYDHLGPDFPDLMFMHIANMHNMYNLHNMQARAGYARAKGRKLIAGKTFWRVFSSRKDRCVFEAFKYFLASWAIMQCSSAVFLFLSTQETRLVCASYWLMLINIDWFDFSDFSPFLLCNS